MHIILNKENLNFTSFFASISKHFVFFKNVQRKTNLQAITKIVF